MYHAEPICQINNVTLDILLTFGYKPRGSRSGAALEKERAISRYSYVKYFVVLIVM